MSVPVALADLAEKIDSYGPVAYLVTTGEGGAPHVVSVAVALEGEELVAGAGRSTSRNAGVQPVVSLVWAGAPGADYCLIVDGTARVGDERIAVRPTRAVLHRLAQADASLPSCVTLL